MSVVELVEDDGLEALASTIRAEVQRGREGQTQAVDSYIAIGHALNQARDLLPSDQAFGEWCRVNGFTWDRAWRKSLCDGARFEGPVRKAVLSQLNADRRPNFEKAVKQVVAALGSGRADRPSLAVIHEPTSGVTPDVFPTIVIDPPWQYGNTATRGAAEDHYPTMHYDELVKLELPALDDAHLYLWVTNGFLREGLDLCEAWDFKYKTLLTWVKPQMGMGNYFRSVTEHVIFGTRGSLPTRRKDRTNVVNADRTRHSAKPEAFYDLVEEMSPSPYMEMFARRRRMGDWHYWGNEA